jgi:hypothetical protein
MHYSITDAHYVLYSSHMFQRQLANFMELTKSL